MSTWTPWEIFAIGELVMLLCGALAVIWTLRKY